ncbi:S8 family peptidase [Chitinophaga pendula]|uniref:S8 family peptidase n=1 Tax=Chitinophaga TaxID=79328 RepID=UPI000BAE85DF|nr:MULTISPECIES: S8 family peptidase [Chitinophaga]ASZ14022.1 hypothetical protein CK934_25250 [Chitinophaga sp. MD30]UCJ08350.1 S8 family peptidase [Chitinophaga pendula]
MSAGILKTFSVLLCSLCITSQLIAQSNNHTDSIYAQYAATTLSRDSAQAAPWGYLVKFRQYPGNPLLTQHGLLHAIGAQHFILRDATFDSLQLKTVVYLSPANANWKSSRQLLSTITRIRPSDSLTIQITTPPPATNVRSQPLQYANVQQQIPEYNMAVVRVKAQDWPRFIGQAGVVFADIPRQPRTEVAIREHNLSINLVSSVHQLYPALKGTNRIVAIKEQLFDTADVDLKGKYVPSAIASPKENSHATSMATWIAGMGNSSPQGRGVASAARLTSSTFDRLLPDEKSFFQQFGLTLQNHSYGTPGIENYYGQEAQAYDQLVLEADTILHVFSSGNIGNNTPDNGTYQGLAAFANLTGTFKQAKNVLVVGAVDSFYNLLDGGIYGSSRGPAYDGRVKPEVVTYGQAGTSDAAATTTGIAVLLQEAYALQYGKTPPSALTKTILINSADDIGTAQVDYYTGFGLVNALEAIRTVKEQRFRSGTVTAGTTQTYTIPVPAGMRQLKVTLGWNDVPAAVNAPKALVNDLDLFVTDANGRQFVPWILNPAPNAQSLRRAAVRGRDSLNNQEQVTIDMPPAGNVQIQVRGQAIPGNTPVTHYIAYQYTPLSSFSWRYPAPADILTAGTSVPLRWQTNASGNFDLSYTLDSGRTWTAIASQIAITGKTWRWQLPDTFSTARLRMSNADTTWYSDYFYLATAPDIQAGFDCPDEVMVYWNPTRGVAGYEVLTLENGALRPIVQTTDTFAIISRTQTKSIYFAVRTVHKDGWKGMNSYTLNTKQQGLECYFQQTLADATEDSKVSLYVRFASLYKLKRFSWERRESERGSFITLSSQNITQEYSYSSSDVPPHSGIIFYRVKLELTDGRIYYSDPIPVNILLNQAFHLFPVPTTNEIRLLSKEIKNDQLRLIDISGRVVAQLPVTQFTQVLSLQSLAPGVYWCVIYRDKQRIFIKKIIKL